MRRFILVGFFYLVFGIGIQAQQHHIQDTVILREVIHYGELKKYQSGVKIEQIKTNQIQLASEGGIENVLMRFSPIYIKSNAAGLSTIRFRGTSPNHTTVNFGGLNINSLTLGHSNLSNIPSFLFDGISLQYGGSSAVNGSGAIGGALFLGLSNNWTNGIKINVKNTAGSFGEFLNGAKIYAGNGKWEVVTRFYLYRKKNDFPFYNCFTGDVENPGTVIDVQKGASLNNKGLLQEFNYRFSTNNYFKSSVWVENNWQQVQPNMQSNYVYSSTQEIENKNIRIWTEYNNNSNFVKYRAGLGYVHDNQVFDNNKLQIITTNRAVAEFQTEIDITTKLGIKAGAKYKFIKPEVYAYAGSVINHENNLDLFLSSFFQINRQFRTTLNLRQMFVSNFKAPFTPSLGAEYNLRVSDYSFLKFTSSLSGSYRIPTFNDRYWGIQGNPDLKPESGKNLEFGAAFNYENGNWQSKLAINTFYMDVDNWIEWRNFGVWKAHNVQEVVSKGVEFASFNTFPIATVTGTFILNYTFNSVQAIKNISETGIVNRQMIYVPKHMGNVSLFLKFKKWQFLTDGHFTGSRFTDDFGYNLNPYFLANCGINYQLFIQKHQFDLSLSSQNIFNSSYQNERYFAMPGRSFRFSINYNIHLTK